MTTKTKTLKCIECETETAIRYVRKKWCINCYQRLRRQGKIPKNQKHIKQPMVIKKYVESSYDPDPDYLEVYDEQLQFEIDYYKRTGKVLKRNI